MARIRSLHPGLCTSEEYMALSIAAKAVWPPLWTEADDHGVFEWKPITLKARLLPADNVDMAALLGELQEKGVVQRFTDNGRDYGIIKGFCKWQRPKLPTYRFPFPEHLRSYAGWTPPKPKVLCAEGPPLPEDYPSKGPTMPEDYPSTPVNPNQRKEEGGRREEEGGSSEPTGSGGEAAEPDLLKAAFDAGIKVLGKAGHSEQQARGLIGKWRKEFGEGAVLEALGKCQLSGVSEPVSYITAALKAIARGTTGPPKLKFN